MFAVTPRLALRPGWPEDAPALTAAVGHPEVTRNLSGVPWPYLLEHAETFLTLERAPDDLRLFVLDRLAPGAPLIGCVGLHAEADGHALGYWLTPTAWGRGYMTEAAGAVVRLARDALRLPRLRSGHYVDNPASGDVLRKLGFAPTGRTERQFCPTRGCEVEVVGMELAFAEARLPLAA